MSMDHSFWLGVAGIGYTAGTLILGRMIERGKKEQKLERVAEDVGNLRNDLGRINDSLVNCQRASGENRGILKTKAETIDEELAKLRRESGEHAADRDIHTDREWRQNTTERLEAIAKSIGTRIGTLETNVVNQIESLRSQIKKGQNGNGGKLS